MTFSSTRLLLIAQKWALGSSLLLATEPARLQAGHPDHPDSYPQPAVWLDPAGPRTELSVVLRKHTRPSPPGSGRGARLGSANTHKTDGGADSKAAPQNEHLRLVRQRYRKGCQTGKGGHSTWQGRAQRHNRAFTEVHSPKRRSRAARKPHPMEPDRNACSQPPALLIAGEACSAFNSSTLILSNKRQGSAGANGGVTWKAGGANESGA